MTWVSVWLVVVMTLTSAADADAEVQVIDGDTIRLDGETIRLHGIDAPELGQSCATPGGTWACGTVAAQRLQQMVTGRVVCQRLSEDRYGRTIGRCQADGRDVGAALVGSGLAWAFRRFSDDYVVAEQSARAARLGIWAGEPDVTPPWVYRAARWKVAEQAAPQGCPIKGNISRNGRIYHTPWSPWYQRTRVSPDRGERWFCTERDALAAGWRAPRGP